MPDVTTRIGPLTIPVPSDGQITPISDPAITGFLDYFRFWIRFGLDQKIADPNSEQPDPLPEDNLFDYDPMGNWVRNVDGDDEMQLPALYIWQNGPSRFEYYSMISDIRVRSFRIMYVCKPIFSPHGSEMFAGLGAVVDAILCRACSRGAHPLYGYNMSPPGTPIQTSLNLLGWKYTGGQPGMIAPVPGTSPRVGGPGDGMLVEYFPALLGAMTIWERFEEDTFTEADQSCDIAFNARINDTADTREPVTIMQRYLISPSEHNDSGE